MKIVFLCVDAQNDFMKKDGKLYIQNAEVIHKTIGDLTLMAEENDITVINTADWHNKDSKEISNDPDFIDTFPKHCMADTKGAEFILEANPMNPLVIPYDQPLDNQKEDLLEFASEIIIQKDKFDVFEGNPHTERILELVNPDVVFVYGVATNVCVDAAVMGLLKRNYNTYVVIDAIKELPNLLNQTVIKWATNGVKYSAVNIPLPQHAQITYNVMFNTYTEKEKIITKVDKFLKENINE